MTAAPHPLRAAKNTALDLLRRPDLLLAFALANLAARLAVHEPLRLLGRQLLATILAPQPPRAWLRPLLLASLATIAALGLVGPALVALLHALRRRRPLDPKSFLAGPAAVVAASLAAATVAATLLLQGAVGWQLLAATVAQRSRRSARRSSP